MKRLIVVLVVALALLGCEEKLKGSFAISSVSFGEETGGSFFLGSGSVKERIVYYGFRQYGEGQKLFRIDALSTTVIETDGREPMMERWVRADRERDVYKLYVPVGTIIREFRLP